MLIYASFKSRVAARLVDSFLLILVNAAILTVTDVVFGSEYVFGTITYLACLLAAISYEVGFLVGRGATPGKVLLNLRVVTAQGASLKWRRALARYFAYYWLDALLLGVGSATSMFDSRKRTLHDRMCRTQVIRSM